MSGFSGKYFYVLLKVARQLFFFSAVGILSFLDEVDVNSKVKFLIDDKARV